VVVLPREVDHPMFDDIRDSATAALQALGQTTGLTHMEWFRRADGSIAISEVASRPPGAQITTATLKINVWTAGSGVAGLAAMRAVSSGGRGAPRCPDGTAEFPEGWVERVLIARW